MTKDIDEKKTRDGNKKTKKKKSQEESCFDKDLVVKREAFSDDQLKAYKDDEIIIKSSDIKEYASLIKSSNAIKNLKPDEAAEHFLKLGTTVGKETRFQPGEVVPGSGVQNKKRGQGEGATGGREKFSQVLDKIGEKSGDKIFELCVQQALEGNVPSQQFVLNKVYQARQGVRIPVKIHSETKTSEGRENMMQAVWGLLELGEISLEEAGRMTIILKNAGDIEMRKIEIKAFQQSEVLRSANEAMEQLNSLDMGINLKGISNVDYLLSIAQDLKSGKLKHKDIE